MATNKSFFAANEGRTFRLRKGFSIGEFFCTLKSGLGLLLQLSFSLRQQKKHAKIIAPRIRKRTIGVVFILFEDVRACTVVIYGSEQRYISPSNEHPRHETSSFSSRQNKVFYGCRKKEELVGLLLLCWKNFLLDMN